MKLKSYQVFNYKCIDESGQIDFGQQVALVGKNEAGKTATITALSKLNPTGGNEDIFTLEEYPRRKLNKYKKVHTNSPESPVRAIFELSEEEVEAIEKSFGEGVLNSTLITVSKKYEDNCRYINIDANAEKYIKHLIASAGINGNDAKKLKKFTTLISLEKGISALDEEIEGAQKILDKINSLRDKSLTKGIIDIIDTPKFFLFDDYAVLPGKISLNKLKTYSDNRKDPHGEGLETALALINLAGAEIEEFLNPENFERLIADLESASISITDTLNSYWSQNKNLEIEFKLNQERSGNQVTDTTLHIRVKNTKHRMSVPFDDRSKGFVWFFSFLVAFSAYEDMGEELILLLDEPGLNLHGKAQQDLLRYFDEVLATNHQLAFTTHSPFMINPNRLHEVRIVEDKEDRGTVVSNDPLTGSSDTLFPLQAALGFDMTQTLFVAPDNLLVEGPSDLIYLKVATYLLQSDEREGLSDNWTIVPTGGIDKIPSFVSLMGGNGLRIAIFMDVSERNSQRIGNLLKLKLLEKNSILTVGKVLENDQQADMEDLFSDSSYLKLVNLSYKKQLNGKEITLNDIQGHDPRILKRVENYFVNNNINDGKFSHYKPAADLLANSEWQAEVFDKITLDNFEKAFLSLNQILSKPLAQSNLPVHKTGNLTSSSTL